MSDGGLSPGGKLVLAGGFGLLLYALSRRREEPAPEGYLEARSQIVPPALPPLQPLPAPQPGGGPELEPLRALERYYNDAVRGDPELWAMQHWLRDLGYDPGPIDGRWGSFTWRALQDFVRAVGLPPSAAGTASQRPPRSTVQRVEQEWETRLELTGGVHQTQKFGQSASFEPAYAPQGYDKPGALSEDFFPASACAGVGRARRY